MKSAFAMASRTVLRIILLGTIILTGCSPRPDPFARHLVISPDLSFDTIGPPAAIELREYEPMFPDSIRWISRSGILEVSGLWKNEEKTFLSRLGYDRAPWLDGVSLPVTVDIREDGTSLPLLSHRGIPENRSLTWDTALIPPGIYRWTLGIPVAPHIHPRQVSHLEITFQHLVEHEPGIREVMVDGETRKALLLSPGTVVSYPLPVRTSVELTLGISGTPAIRRDGSVIIEYFEDESTDTLGKLTSLGERWHETTVTIPESETGSGIRFRCAGAPVFLGSPVLHLPSDTTAPRQDRPNILLISLDTVRADGMSPELMPRLTAFIKRCVSFNRAISQAPVTETAHHSIFTGQYVSKHGGNGRKRISETIPTITTILAKNGYRTAAFTDGVLVSAVLGFAYGFERYWEYLGQLKDKHHLPVNLLMARSWIEDVHTTAPWFMFLHTYQAHAPYLDRSRQPPYMVGVTPSTEKEAYEKFITLIDSPQEIEDEPLIDLARTAYESELRYLDSQIGAFLDSLEAGGLLDRTVVVLLSDHGEGFAEHGLVGHNNSLYQELLHIPLYIRFPGDRWGGTEISTVVQTVDILPTLLDHAGIEHPDDIDGRSLLSLCDGSKSSNTPAFSEFFTSYAVTHWPYKLVVSRRGDGVSLFDLVKDPGEQTDIYSTCEEDIVRSLRSSLLTLLGRTVHGMLITVNRPVDLGPPLNLYLKKDEHMEILFDKAGDWNQPGPHLVRIHPVPSRFGDVAVIVTNATEITVSLEAERFSLPEGVSHVGPYEIAVRRCTGPQQIRTAANIPLGRDLSERLNLLGYTE